MGPALAGGDGHGPAALGAVDQAREQRRATDDAGGHDLGVAGLEQFLDSVKGLAVDNRRDRNHHDLTDRLQFLGLGPLVALMLAHIGSADQDAVNLHDAQTSAITGEDTAEHGSASWRANVGQYVERLVVGETLKK